jgi:hypothetical protein
MSNYGVETSMIRRVFIALAMAVLPWRSKRAEAQDVANPSPSKDNPDFQGLVSEALKVAAKVEDGADYELRQIVAHGEKKVSGIAENIKQAGAEEFSQLIQAQHNLTLLLLEVLRRGKDAEGAIELTKERVSETLESLCPLFPFC